MAQYNDPKNIPDAYDNRPELRDMSYIDKTAQKARDSMSREATDFNRKDKTARKIDDTSRKSRLKADIMDAKGR